MAQSGQTRTLRTELAHGLSLVKEETDFLKNFEHLDQINTYFVENELELPADVTVDITGSQGVAFNGPLDGKVLQLTQSVEAGGRSQLCELRLFGDWELKIRFTYALKNVPVERAKQIKLEPSKTKNRNREEEIKQQQLKEENAELFGGEIAQQLMRCRAAFKNFAFELASQQQIQDVLADKEIDHFVDPDFPPTMSSICHPDESFPFEQEIIWKRAKEFLMPSRHERPQIFSDQVQPSDVIEGSLGDAWFASALATLAEQPQLLRKLFITQSYQSDGIYKVQICKGGIWQEVTIDDFFPCSTSTGGMALFSRTTTSDLWVLLLEKAYAKLHLNYYTLRGGYISDAIQDLTGCPCLAVKLEETETQRDLETGQFALTMEQHLRNGYLIAASTQGEELWAESQNNQLPSGLLLAHAYSLLDVKTTSANQVVFKLRNVWRSELPWTGKYQKGSRHWNAQLARDLGVDLDDEESLDECIWMTQSEFAENFQSVTVCMVRPGDETLRLKGEFLKPQAFARAIERGVRSKYQYEVQLEQSQRVNFVVHQEDIRIQDVIRRRPYMSLGLAIFMQDQFTGNLEYVTATQLTSERQNIVDVELQPGRYFIVPRTSGVGFQKPIDAGREGKIQVLTKSGELTDLVATTLRDVFRRLEPIHMGGSLSYQDFNTLLKRVSNEQISPDYFKANILAKHAHSSRNEVCLRGFLDWFKHWIVAKGVQSAPAFFEKLGYDEDLYPIESRSFSLSIHSPSAVTLYVQDRTDSEGPNANSQVENIEEVIDKEVVTRFGKSVQQEPRQYDLIMRHNEETDTFSFGMKNLKTIPAAFTLDCSASRNVLFGEEGGKVTRYIKSNEFLFFMHVEAAEDVEEFTVEYSVTVEEI